MQRMFTTEVSGVVMYQVEGVGIRNGVFGYFQVPGNVLILALVVLQFILYAIFCKTNILNKNKRIYCHVHFITYVPCRALKTANLDFIVDSSVPLVMCTQCFQLLPLPTLLNIFLHVSVFNVCSYISVGFVPRIRIKSCFHVGIDAIKQPGKFVQGIFFFAI